jgi:hypothetical protein
MGNGEFMGRFTNAQAFFLPYLISDHSPAILSIPNRLKKKNRPFRFSNYITDKQDFIPIVQQEWCKSHEGHKMFILVKKLKSLKVPLKKLSWKDGNIFDRVAMLRKKLESDQTKLEADVYNEDVRKEAAKTLKEYNEAVIDESKLLYQMARVEWLNEGDKNSNYFHLPSIHSYLYSSIHCHSES